MAFSSDQKILKSVEMAKQKLLKAKLLLFINRDKKDTE